ncbi:ribonuclease P protein component [Kangiella sediminilitoris]|uniref:Ribonuclease P protein component n=1 Tax=Kangiella sediminilitoris TaxID=1144748 RepID=A0A1B3BE13_9GAMM|nr:ribonuclease P protein component [Kangiella sediminilitoris]AOE51040.1 Ribonuclease P protein component [Kangiella sediminilitoris]
MSKEPTGREELLKSFPRNSRLLTAEDYKKVFKKPVKLVCPAFTLLATPNSLKRPRLGLIVAKKNVKLAVERNRLKRVCRQSFRVKQHELPAFDIVLLARHGSSNMTNAVLFEHLNRLWSRVIKKCSGY